MSDMPSTRREKHKFKSLSARQQFYGRMFILPWQIGFVLFFFAPVLQSVWYSFSKASPLDEISGSIIEYFKSRFVGTSNYKYIWAEDPDFMKNLETSITGFLYSLPIIIILSLVLSLFLNQKFRGRLIARAVFFLPVIIATGVVINIISQDLVAAELRNQGNSSIYNAVNFTNLLMNMGLPQMITERISSYISSIFDLIWSSCVQTILFLAGLQSIPAGLYEVADVEGANAWEKFWFITVPMLMNVLLLNTIYTSIELFTATTNPAMKQAFNLIMQQSYNSSAAIIWSYCGILGLVIGFSLLIIMRFIKKVSSY